MLHVQLLTTPFDAQIDGKYVRFTPEGHNPSARGEIGITPEWSPGLEAQFFVGLAVRGKAKWKASQIRDYIMRFRQKQLLAEGRKLGVERKRLDELEHGGSVVPQLGYWSAVTKRGPERSVAANIIHVPSEIESEDQFKENARALAMKLAVKFDQDTVILRFARAGVIEGMAQTTWRK